VSNRNDEPGDPNTIRSCCGVFPATPSHHRAAYLFFSVAIGPIARRPTNKVLHQFTARTIFPRVVPIMILPRRPRCWDGFGSPDRPLKTPVTPSSALAAPKNRRFEPDASGFRPRGATERAPDYPEIEDFKNRTGWSPSGSRISFNPIRPNFEPTFSSRNCARPGSCHTGAPRGSRPVLLARTPTKYRERSFNFPFQERRSEQAWSADRAGALLRFSPGGVPVRWGAQKTWLSIVFRIVREDHRSIPVPGR